MLLIIATVAVYGACGSFKLLNTLDDKYYLILNDSIKGFSFSNIYQAFNGYYVGNYAPLHIISYMVDYSLWGLAPAGYHLENVLIHLINGLLFYLFLRRLSMTEWHAAAASWIFLLHPVQIETVAWVSQRKNLLAMFFFLLALLAYQALTARKDNRLRIHIFSVASIVAAMLCKSVAVIFPAVIILYDITYSRVPRRSVVHFLLDKLPYIFAAAAVAVMAIISQAPELGGGRRGYPGGTPLTTFYTMVPVLAGYLRDCLYPFEISPFYMIPIRVHPDSIFAANLIILIFVCGAGIALYYRCRHMFFWFGLFFIALVPVLQFVPLVTLKNDRYLYFPMLGFSVLAVSTAIWIQQSLSVSLCRAFRVFCFLPLLAIPFFTFKQTLCWRDDVSIWIRAVEVDSENRLAWLQLAKGYTARKDAQNAMYALSRYKELKLKYGPVRGYETD